MFRIITNVIQTCAEKGLKTIPLLHEELDIPFRQRKKLIGFRKD